MRPEMIVLMVIVLATLIVTAVGFYLRAAG
jgi:hypothetical protein